MTDRRPPPPRVAPTLESYRPSDERPQRPPRPPEHADQVQRREPRFYGGQGEPPPRVTETQGGGAPQPHRRPPPTERELGGFITKVLLAVLGLVVLAGAAAAFAVTLLPADFVRDRVVAAVKERTGRDLVISGGASFKLYPSLGVSLKDVSLSAAPGVASSGPFVTMESLDSQVALLPLLRREVRIETLVLRKPRFALEVDKNGRKSWSLGELASSHASVGPALDAPTTPGLALGIQTARAVPGGADVLTPTPRMDDLKLEDVRIEDGSLTYRNAITGGAHDVSDLNMHLKLEAISAPLSAAGSLVWKGRKVDFDSVLNSLQTIREDRPAKLTLSLVSDAATASFEGTATVRDALETEGILATKSPSMRTLLAWLGTDLPPSQGFGPLAAKGLVRSSGSQIALQSAEISLDHAVAHGQITLETSGARPYIKANLKIDALNLNTYASDGATTAEEPVSKAPTSQSPAVPQAGRSEAQSIDDLLARDVGSPQAPGPKVKGFTKRVGWSEAPYRLASFGFLDTDAKLSIGRLLVREIKLGQTEVTVALKNRVMKTTIDDVRLYDGRGRGFITVDASNAASAAIAANLAFDGIAGRPFLTDAADIDKLDGKGRIAFTLAGRGANDREIVETLNGKAEFSFTDGAIVGINVPQMIRAASQGRFNDLSTSPAEKTDFSEFSSTWAIAAGTAQNQDLKMVSPLLRLAGAGTVALPQRQVDYVLRPRVVADLSGQGGNQSASGVEIPVRMHGSWDKPKFTPDLTGLARDPNKAVETIKEIGKQFKGKSSGEIVEGLFGKGQNGEGAPAKKLLDQFLKQ